MRREGEREKREGAREYAEKRKNAACAQLSSPQANFQRKSHAHKREKDAEMNTVNTQNELLNGCWMVALWALWMGTRWQVANRTFPANCFCIKKPKEVCNKANAGAVALAVAVVAMCLMRATITPPLLLPLCSVIWLIWPPECSAKAFLVNAKLDRRLLCAFCVLFYATFCAESR